MLRSQATQRHKPHQIRSTRIVRRKVTISTSAPIPCIHRPSILIMNIAPTSSEKIVKICFHCGQRCHFALQYPNWCQWQTPPNKKCYNCEEKWHFANACPNPCSHPPLPPSTKATPNHKRGSTSVKATIMDRLVILPIDAPTYVNYRPQPRQPEYGTNSSQQEVLQLWTKESIC
jgi:hypothetical protein